jgi:hypothetical protein
MLLEASLIDPTSTKQRSTVVIVVQKSPTPKGFGLFYCQYHPIPPLKAMG